jgi:hypothetical protein
MLQPEPHYRRWCPLGLRSGGVSDDRGLALAAADAERGNAATGVAAAHLVEEGDEDAAAAGSDRVAEGDRV